MTWHLVCACPLSGATYMHQWTGLLSLVQVMAWCQAITWPNTDLLAIGSLGTNHPSTSPSRINDFQIVKLISHTMPGNAWQMCLTHPCWVWLFWTMLGIDESYALLSQGNDAYRQQWTGSSLIHIMPSYGLSPILTIAIHWFECPRGQYIP